MARRREAGVFGLAFLDAMTCGLGAVILLYMVINASVGLRAGRQHNDLQAEVDLLEQEVLDGLDDLVDLRNAKHALTERQTVARGLSDRLIEALEAHNVVWERKLEDTGSTRQGKGFKKTLRRRMRRAQNAMFALELVTTLEDENYVYWIEGHDSYKRRRRGGEESQQPLKIKGKPKHVGDYLNDMLFAKTKSTVITSATLTTNGRFKWVKRELGIKAKTLSVESPFDFRKQSMLVVPKIDSWPNQDSFVEEVAEELDHILRDTAGRALGLFTSYKNMNAVYERLSCLDLPFRIMMQGEKPKAKLLEEFMEDTYSVLLGTKSFWQGVDVRGEALTCLFMDKIPFPPPSDPVIAAMDDDPDENAFWDHSVPRATIAIRQGFGRLIRSREDAGICVIFDQRILKKNYGDKMVNSLPEVKIQTRAERIPDFLEKHGLFVDLEEADATEGVNMGMTYGGSVDEEVPF